MKKPNITFKSLLEPIKNIEERNEYFNYLSKKGKLLEIVWEALQMLCKGQMEAIGCQTGYWDSGLEDVTDNITTSKQFQKSLIKYTTKNTCQVCARGGIMLSRIILGNSIAPDDFFKADGSTYNTKDFIDFDNFIEMEREYEQDEHDLPYEKGTTEKLMNIYCNILVNGYFNTKDTTDYLI